MMTAGNDSKEDVMSPTVEVSGSADVQGALWSERARDWSVFQEGTALPLYDAAMRQLRIGVGTRLLDVGCGSGMFCRMASQRGATVVGFDAAPSLIEIARQRAPYGCFHVGEMETLPFTTGSFDVVTGFNAFAYAERPVQALTEATRVVRAGGSVFVATWGRPEHCQARAYMSAVVSVLPPPPPGTPGPFALSDDQAVRELARSAGLAPDAIVEVSVPFVYPDLDSALRGIMSAGPAARAIHAAGEGRVRDLVATALKPYCLPSGGVRMENRFRYLIATKPA
jgi:SAM-dependent methyltransferase